MGHCPCLTHTTGAMPAYWVLSLEEAREDPGWLFSQATPSQCSHVTLPTSGGLFRD